ncbi:hypothetical protein G6L81_08495 [Agrobacterium rhizogenes]|nr:hypothetical protein [Rhizobium rhizogenes]
MLKVVFRKFALIDGLHHGAVSRAFELQIKFCFREAWERYLKKITALRVYVAVDNLVRQNIEHLRPANDSRPSRTLFDVFGPDDFVRIKVGAILNPMFRNLNAMPEIKAPSITPLM